MAKIPLLRPKQLAPNVFWPFMKESIRTHRLANHGPAYLKAQELIAEKMTHNSIVSNATVGLELAMRAMWKPGSRILMPSFTFKATYIAAKNAGMFPIIEAADRDTWALDPQIISPSNCDGAIVVSPFGHSLDFDKYENRGVPILYDLAGAWGLDYRGPNAAVYSWHATKNFCVGEGGVVVSSNYNLIQEITRLSNFGYTNAKISELQCALACAHLTNGVPRHTQTYLKYLEGLKNVLPFYPAANLAIEHCSLLAFRFPSSDLYKLTANEIFECRRYYFPLLEDLFPEAELLHKTPSDHPTRSIIALPRDVTDSEIRRVLKTVETLIHGDAIPLPESLPE